MSDCYFRHHLRTYYLLPSPHRSPPHIALMLATIYSFPTSQTLSFIMGLTSTPPSSFPTPPPNPPPPHIALTIALTAATISFPTGTIHATISFPPPPPHTPPPHIARTIALTAATISFPTGTIQFSDPMNPDNPDDVD